MIQKKLVIHFCPSKNDNNNNVKSILNLGFYFNLIHPLNVDTA